MPNPFLEPSMVIQFGVIDHHPASGATPEMIQKKTIVSRRKRYESFLRVVGGSKFLGSNRPARRMIFCQPLSGNAHRPPIEPPDAEVAGSPADQERDGQRKGGRPWRPKSGQQRIISVVSPVCECRTQRTPAEGGQSDDRKPGRECMAPTNITDPQDQEHQ